MDNQFRFPSDFKRLISQLSDENQWNILECLINNDNKVKYSIIQKTLEIHKGTLNYHLKELQKSGWIRRKSQKGSTFEEEGSFYEIAKFNLKMLEGGLKAMDKKYYQTSWKELQFPLTEEISKIKFYSKPFSLKTSQNGNEFEYVYEIKESDDVLPPLLPLFVNNSTQKITQQLSEKSAEQWK